MHKRNCFTSMICAAVFACFYVLCDDLMESGAYWPLLICKAGLALSCLQLIISAVCWIRCPSIQEPFFPLSVKQCLRTLTVLVIMAAWIFCLKRVGFLTSSAVALCAVAITFEPERSIRKIVRDVAVCVAFTALCYCAFIYLGIHFPKTLLI